jgi:hypothetical protein
MVGACIGSGQTFSQGFEHDCGAHFEFWPKADVATRSEATIHGLVFVNTFSIFCSPFSTNSCF